MDVALRSEIARLQAELVRVKQRANEELGALRAENARLRKQLDHLSDDPLLTLLRDPKAAAFPPHTPSASTGKLCADARYFEFGQVEEFLGGFEFKESALSGIEFSRRVQARPFSHRGLLPKKIEAR